MAEGWPFEAGIPARTHQTATALSPSPQLLALILIVSGSVSRSVSAALGRSHFLAARREDDRRAGAAADRGADRCALLAADQRANQRAACRGTGDLPRVLLLRRRRGTSHRRGADRVAIVLTARPQRVEAYGDVRASLHLGRARRVGHDAADAACLRAARSRRARPARARCAVTASSTRLVSEPTAVSSVTFRRARGNRDLRGVAAGIVAARGAVRHASLGAARGAAHRRRERVAASHSIASSAPPPAENRAPPPARCKHRLIVSFSLHPGSDAQNVKMTWLRAESR